MPENDVQSVSPTGWKTYLAGAAAIIGGVSLALVTHQYEAGLASVIAGLTILGLGGKLAKLIAIGKEIAKDK
jgi:hypothetical protein